MKTLYLFFFFFQAEDGIRDIGVTGVQTCALPICFRPFDERVAQGLSADAVIRQLFGRLQSIEEALIIAIPPPPVRGIGNSGGYRMQVHERTGADVRRALAATIDLMGRARRNPNLAGVFTTDSANSPQVYLEI